MRPEGQPDIAVPARAIGEPHRAIMLSALLDGGQLSAGELARLARVTPATASEHLKVLQSAGLVAVVQQGRHRRYGVADPGVARAIEALQAVAPVRPIRSLSGARISQQLYDGRRCYDHLAGELGMRVTGIMQRAGIVPVVEPGAVVAVPEPLPRCAVSDILELELRPAPRSRRPWARGCLDWSHRQPHLAGYLGAEVMGALSRKRWILPARDTRAVALTAEGRDGLEHLERLLSASG